MCVADDDFSAWTGRSETVPDTLGPTPAAALAATLDPSAAPAWRGRALAPRQIGDAVATLARSQP